MSKPPDPKDRWCVTLPRTARDDAVKLRQLYRGEFPVSLGNAVAKALREEVKRMEAVNVK